MSGSENAIRGMTETEMLNWIEQHLDDLSVTRDRKRGTRFHIDFCYNSTGCPGAVEAKSIRGAICLAQQEQQL